MKFSLVILGAPASSQCAATAYRFATSVLAQGHQIYRIFFYHDGIHNASSLHCPAQDEANPSQQWQALATAYNVSMVACIASSLRRGVLNGQEAKRYQKQAANMDEDSIQLSGLGELIDATANSDRIITFGN